MSVDSNDVLTSVRYGKDAMTASDTGTSETRTEGVGSSSATTRSYN
nr:glycoside hydrolase family 70 protein [Leuconostoc mesenteroides]